MKYIYIRDDDVYKCDNKFKRMFSFLKENKIPAVYGVIPKLTTKNLSDFLNREKNKNPNLIDIVQHGFKHQNYGGKIKNKYEFGPSRNFTQQRADILNGYLRMKKLFGKNFTPAFIPPYHGYNRNTLKAIHELKIPIFSGDSRITGKRNKFINLPINISLNDYNKKGKTVALKSNILIKRLLASLSRPRGVIGLLLHHNFVIENNNFKEIKIFFLFIKKLEREKRIKPILFSQLLKNNHSGPHRYSHKTP